MVYKNVTVMSQLMRFTLQGKDLGSQPEAIKVTLHPTSASILFMSRLHKAEFYSNGVIWGRAAQHGLGGKRPLQAVLHYQLVMVLERIVEPLRRWALLEEMCA